MSSGTARDAGIDAGVCVSRCALARPAHYHWRDGSRAPFGHARRPCCGGAWDFCGGSSATLFPTLELFGSSAETRRLMRSLAFPWECWQSSAAPRQETGGVLRQAQDGEQRRTTAQRRSSHNILSVGEGSEPRSNRQQSFAR